MDFKKDVELMLSCLKEGNNLDARAYHGGLSHLEKITADTQFKNKAIHVQCNTVGLYAEPRSTDTGVRKSWERR